ncbi:hypothetical protein FRAAL0105 [Frankia alni ACN14a]|uniref:Uncharacterized protein n=1 Tax=Frankia alni (strain DSM 45986 / CECT 9034 / ACN14a) TaxID=326424 RepID=Q0RUF4_FRAAA|nr:hypothetical protein FRAAL0105 [Frankia alni ACN14a]
MPPAAQEKSDRAPTARPAKGKQVQPGGFSRAPATKHALRYPRRRRAGPAPQPAPADSAPTRTDGVGRTAETGEPRRDGADRGDSDGGGREGDEAVSNRAAGGTIAAAARSPVHPDRSLHRTDRRIGPIAASNRSRIRTDRCSRFGVVQRRRSSGRHLVAANSTG